MSDDLGDTAERFARILQRWLSPPPPPPKGKVVALRDRDIQWQPNGGEGGIFFGGVRIPKNVDLHYLVMGTPRSGKTTTIRLMLEDILPDVLNPSLNTRAVIYDPKREMQGILAGMGLSEVTITLDPRHALSYAPDFTSTIDDELGAQQLAAAMVPTRQSQDGTDYFDSALRALIESVVIGLIECHERTGRSWSLRTVLNILEDDQLIRLVAGSHHKGQKDVQSFLDGRMDTVRDLRGVTRNHLNDYSIIANLWHQAECEGRTFSIDEWIITNRILLLPAPPVNEDDDPSDATSQLNRLIFGIIADRLLLQPEARRTAIPPRTWAVLDEYRFARALPGTTHLLAMGPSKGVRVVVGAQSYSGLQDSLGKERAEELLDLCALKAFFRAGNRETARVMAEQFGHVREVVQQTSFGGSGTSTTEVEQDRPVLVDSAFLNLPLPVYDHATGTGTKLIGYYRTAGIGGLHESFRSELPMQRLYGTPGMLRSVAPGYDFRPRPKWQQKPIPFTDQELQELYDAFKGVAPRRSSSILRKLRTGSTKHLFHPKENDK